MEIFLQVIRPQGQPKGHLQMKLLEGTRRNHQSGRQAPQLRYVPDGLPLQKKEQMKFPHHQPAQGCNHLTPA